MITVINSFLSTVNRFSTPLHLIQTDRLIFLLSFTLSLTDELMVQTLFLFHLLVLWCHRRSVTLLSLVKPPPLLRSYITCTETDRFSDSAAGQRWICGSPELCFCSFCWLQILRSAVLVMIPSAGSDQHGTHTGVMSAGVWGIIVRRN